MVGEDGWLDAAWPDPLGCQHQLQSFSILFDE